MLCQEDIVPGLAASSATCCIVCLTTVNTTADYVSCTVHVIIDVKHELVMIIEV